jgi:hypothetical protein
VLFLGSDMSCVQVRGGRGRGRGIDEDESEDVRELRVLWDVAGGVDAGFVRSFFRTVCTFV